MVQQLKLFDFNELAPVIKPKRIRAVFPSFVKIYSVYQYDQQKYTKIYKKIAKLALQFKKPEIYYNVNPYDVINHCYIRIHGAKQSKGDVSHIYRYKVLYKLYEEIAKYIPICINEIEAQTTLKDKLTLYIDEFDRLAELNNTWNLPIKERIIMHIRLLRQLKNGKKIDEVL